VDLQQKQKMFALLKREIQEYRNSFVATPLLVAAVLLVFMLASVLFADRITVVGDSIIDVLAHQDSGNGLNITISIDDDEQSNRDYVITEEPLSAEEELEDWNFSREWTFNPQRREKSVEEAGTAPQPESQSLNPVLNVLHFLFLLLLLVTTGNYLLGTFHQDRRDRSILFWKSMPVSEWQEVGAKMSTACLVAPAIYLAVSVVTQLFSVMLAAFMVWRMDKSPTQVVWDNIDFVALFGGQFSGLLIWMLWALPFYAWLLLSSGAARRSPLLLAVGIPLALIVVEQLFIGSDYLSTAFGHHIPHPGNDGSRALGFYLYQPNIAALDYIGMLLGFIVAGIFLFLAVWFRKYRFES